MPGPRVAIACQGGGSHAAFASGVLRRLLSREMRDRFSLAALSGTSGGAVCASLAWSGLLAGGPDTAIARLRDFWSELAARDPVDAILNWWGLFFARLPVTAEISPYAYEPAAEPRLRDLLTRHLHLDQLPADPRERERIALRIGACDVLSGERVVFEGGHFRLDDVIASAAIPPLFRAVKADGRLYWDGLFATNPPVREFTDLPGGPPDEIWIIQVNPQHRGDEPRTMREITDRRNELAGNLSLAQELHFIEKINELIELHPGLAGTYRRIVIRVVELNIRDLDYASKLDRSAGLIEELVERGERLAPDFFDDRSRWPREGTLARRAVTPHRSGKARGSG